jgi:hypothetical protein
LLPPLLLAGLLPLLLAGLLPAAAGVGAAQAWPFAPGVRPGGRVTFFWAQKKVTKEEGLKTNTMHSSDSLRRHSPVGG